MNDWLDREDRAVRRLALALCLGGVGGAGGVGVRLKQSHEIDQEDSDGD